jgi:hypothetical protein
MPSGESNAAYQELEKSIIIFSRKNNEEIGIIKIICK